MANYSNENEQYYILFIVGLIIIVIWQFFKNKSYKREHNKISLENYKLRTENVLLEKEHLKFQLQPHTLGNVVSTINVLAKNLHHGTESLAESINYILYKGNSHLTSVEDEINFIKNYMQLNQLLHSKMISISFDDSQVNSNSKYYNSPSIPHLVSAYLIENAFKHGDKTQADFLKIQVSLTDSTFAMKVVNKINHKPTEKKNGGLGLTNMKKRLELLLKDKYEFSNSCNEEEYYSILNIRF